MSWILIKSARAILTLFICVSIVFVVLRVSGDPVRELLPDGTPTAIIDEYRARLGLDQPIWTQFVQYIIGLSHGDFGISFADRQPAWADVADRIPATLRLGSLALFCAMAAGIPLGIIAALNRDSWIDRTAMTTAILGYSMPNFFLAITLIFFFSLNLRILPSSGSATPAHFIMPVLTLAVAMGGKVARFSRTAMLEVLGQPYIRTASAKGLPRFWVLFSHAVPNAAIPVMTFFGFELGLLIGGAVVTETVFAWPGVGRLLVVSVAGRDLAVVQTIILLIASTMVAANLSIDLLHRALDPRLRGQAKDANR